MTPFLEVTRLSKSYTVAGNQLDVLKGINLSVNEGEMVAVVGTSGVGKSTLMHVVGGLDRTYAPPLQQQKKHAGQHLYLTT